MPKANSYGKIAKRILILHSRANKLQADLLALEALVTDEAKKAEKSALKAQKPVSTARKTTVAKSAKTAVRTAPAARRGRKPAAK